MPQSIANQASGAGEKRCRDSSTAIMLDTTVESNVNQAPGAGAKRSRVIGQSKYSDLCSLRFQMQSESGKNQVLQRLATI